MMKKLLTLLAVGTFAGTLSAANYDPANLKLIFSKDFSIAPDAVEYNREKVLKFTKEENKDYVSLGTVKFPKDVKVSKDTVFVVSIELAGSKGTTFGLRGFPLLKKGEETSVSIAGRLPFRWGRKASEEISNYTGSFTLAEEPNLIIAPEEITGFGLALFCTSKAGSLWIKSISISIDNQEKDVAWLIKELKSELRVKGFTLEDKGTLLIAKKPDERRYYKLDFKEKKATEEYFNERSFIGVTYIRNEFTPPLFPTGPYIYLPAKTLESMAEKRELSPKELLEWQTKDVKDHNCNTIYYAYLIGNPEYFKEALQIAVKDNIKIFAQLCGYAYLRPKKGWSYYEKVTRSNVQKQISEFAGNKNILAFMPVEESSLEAMPMVMLHRKWIKEIAPEAKLYTLHNHIEPFKTETEALPEWFGFDRYRFRCFSPDWILSPPNLTVKLLTRELREMYTEAAKRGRPLMFVGQSYATFDEIKKDKLLPQSCFREKNPGIWQGSLRYYPPANGMYLQNWLAVSEGAKGILLYHYYGSDLEKRNTPPYEIGLVDPATGKPHRTWTEFGECVKEMEPLFPLFLSWYKEGLQRAKCDNKWVKINSFIREWDKERYYVVLNTRIAEWDNDSPERLKEDTRLYTDAATGELKGLTETDPLTFKVEFDGKEPLWDVLSGKKLTPEKDGKYNLTVKPGRGIVLMQGTEEKLSKIRKRLLKL